jgi:hypothetical protein
MLPSFPQTILSMMNIFGTKETTKTKTKTKLKNIVFFRNYIYKTLKDGGICFL